MSKKQAPLRSLRSQCFNSLGR